MMFMFKYVVVVTFVVVVVVVVVVVASVVIFNSRYDHLASRSHLVQVEHEHKVKNPLKYLT